jgi:polyhydroxybutyrate depolymerase
MKKFLLLAIAVVLGMQTFAQLETRTLIWDGTEREYLEYLPNGYSGEEPVPVVFGLHGLGGSMNNFYNVGMNYMADTAGFILIVPQAEEAFYGEQSIGTAWNSGASMYGIVPNEDVDDTGFLMAVLDSLESNYNIDTESVYFFGFSMGGYMCNRLACEVGDRINAIASVSGTIGNDFDPQPTDHVACLHFHGTADETVAYSSNTSGIGADSLVNFWVDFNNCDETPIVYNYEDTHSDSLTFERYLYNGGDESVAFIKVIGGAHDWYYQPQNDIDYANEIWRFFRNRFTDQPTSKETINSETGIQLYPNPVHDILNIKLPKGQKAQVTLFNSLGSLIWEKLVDGSTSVSLNNLPEANYYVRVTTSETVETYPIMRQ